MRSQNERTPPGRTAGLKKLHGNGNVQKDYTALVPDAAKALKRELAIVLIAADRMAAGYHLAWDDYHRLHQAHQFILMVLGEVRHGH